MQFPAMRLSRFMIATALVFGAMTPAFADETIPADALPGGATTWQKKTGRMAFTHHSANMTFEKRLDRQA